MPWLSPQVKLKALSRSVVGGSLELSVLGGLDFLWMKYMVRDLVPSFITVDPLHTRLVSCIYGGWIFHSCSSEGTLIEVEGEYEHLVQTHSNIVCQGKQGRRTRRTTSKTYHFVYKAKYRSFSVENKKREEEEEEEEEENAGRE